MTMARSMADSSRMLLCMMMLTVLAFNPTSLFTKRLAQSHSWSYGEVPGRSILEDVQPVEGKSYTIFFLVGVLSNICQGAPSALLFLSWFTLCLWILMI